MIKKLLRPWMAVMLAGLMAFGCMTGCSVTGNKRIIRISHNQSETHPTHIGLLAFEEYVEAHLGDKYDVQIFPNELLGPQVKTVELCQTGAIDYVVSSISILESFGEMYKIFNLPYLFDNEAHYHSVMENPEIMAPIYKSTAAAGFEAVTWYNAGSRNFYTVKKMIETPDDLKGMKIRVQQGATNVKMMKLFGASASPMNFGDVYAALQQKVIDGAENNELALTNNKHGEVAKYYSYNMHQMVPDILIANVKFLDHLPPEERAVFDEAARISSQVQNENWNLAVEKAKQEAAETGVAFSYPDIAPFKEKMLPLHQEVIEENPKLAPVYQAIQNSGER